jgi:hypothetical protein
MVLAYYQGIDFFFSAFSRKENIFFLCELCVSSEAPQLRDFRNTPTRGDVSLTQLPA